MLNLVAKRRILLYAILLVSVEVNMDIKSGLVVVLCDNVGIAAVE